MRLRLETNDTKCILIPQELLELKLIINRYKDPFRRMEKWGVARLLIYSINNALFCILRQRHLIAMRAKTICNYMGKKKVRLHGKFNISHVTSTTLRKQEGDQEEKKCCSRRSQYKPLAQISSFTSKQHAGATWQGLLPVFEWCPGKGTWPRLQTTRPQSRALLCHSPTFQKPARIWQRRAVKKKLLTCIKTYIRKLVA